MNKLRLVWTCGVLFAIATLASCGDTAIPKPAGYFRIDLPEHSYTRFNSDCDMSLDVPNYTRVENFKDRQGTDSCWFNITYPKFNAIIYCTYFNVNNNIDKLVHDAYGFAVKHEMKATGLRRTLVEDVDNHLDGIIYDIDGEAASQVQFFVSDSTNHFFRGSLYFNNKPNPDSIAPVLEFVRKDIAHMVNSVRWYHSASDSLPE
jgi:gliding motility-associated lipoprotein GldD